MTMKTCPSASRVPSRPVPRRAAILGLALLCSGALPAHATYLTRQVTTSAGKVEDHLRISGSRLVWQRRFSTDFEIYAYNGSTVLQLTNNGTDDSEPEISGDRLVYFNGTDVLCYDFSTAATSNLSNDAGWQRDPRIDGDHVFWFEWDAAEANVELIRYDLETGTRTNISNNTLKNDHNSDSNLRIHGNRAAWIGSTGSASAVLYHDGSSTVTLGNTAGTTYYKPRITATHVVWLESTSLGVSLACYDGSSTSRIDVTADPVEEIQTGPEGIFVTWRNPSATGGNQLDIYQFDPDTLTLSVFEENNVGHDQYLAVGDGMVAWSHDISDTGTDDAYIKVRDLATGTTVDVSEALWVDEWTVASGRNVAWKGYDFSRSGELEVFVAYWLGSGAMLAGVDLSGEDLSGLVFSGADLRGADLTGVTLDAGALAGALIDAGTVFPDGEDYTTTTFDLSGITLPSALGTWLASLGLESAGADDDSDDDGSSNLMEFALGGDAAEGSSQPVSRPILASAAAADFQYLIAARRGASFGAVGSGALGADIDGVRYRIEGAGNLTDFHEDMVFIGRSDTPPAGTALADLTGTDWEYLRFGFSSPPASGSGFIRVAISEVP